MSVLHIGLCDGRHPIKQNDTLFNIDGSYTRGDNPTAGEPLDTFVFPAAVDDPLAFDEFRETVYNFMKMVGEQDRVYLYVTGLSTLLTSFLWVWIHDSFKWNKVTLVLMHYDRDTEQYKEEYWG